MAAPLTSGTLMPSTSEYTRLPTTTFLPCDGLVLGEPLVGVQRVVVHRDHAEQVVVVLGDRLAGPVLVDVADLEVLEVAAEGAVVRRSSTVDTATGAGEQRSRPASASERGHGRVLASLSSAD